MRRMRTFPAIPQSVHAARRFATDSLGGSPVSMVEAVELMVSELATNCIRHERTSFHITILNSTRELRVEVTDSGSGTPTIRSPGPDEPSGRGM
jgi:signal transduction histidine kinase